MISEEEVIILKVFDDILVKIILWNLSTGEESQIQYKAKKRSIFELFPFEKSRLICLAIKGI